MSNTLKITIVGGEMLGSETSFDFSKPVLVGRSHSADIHLPEPDVSGKHFRFVPDPAGCAVEVLSRNGLVLDGRPVAEGGRAAVSAGSTIALGAKARIRVDAVPSPFEPTPAEMISESQPALFDSDADTASDRDEPPPPPTPPSPPPPPLPEETGSGSFDIGGSADEDSLTCAGDGETQELHTRIGSLEEIAERKRQLERMTVKTRFRVGMMIGVFVVILAGVWYYLGWRSKAIDVNGPYLPNGEWDEATTTLLNESGEKEFLVIYPRNDEMTVYVSPDSNTVTVATWFGTKSDVPFRLEFTRWRNRSDLMDSLEDSFERWMMEESARGSAFETDGGRRPKGEFFESVFPGFIEIQTLRGVRFARAEHTRSHDHELWRGSSIYFRKGDCIHLLRLEVPDIFWKLAKHRVTHELHLAIFATFLKTHWDSPGRVNIIDSKISDDELILRIRRELSAERVGSWPDLAAYIDTLLVRSWGDKPRIQKEAMGFYLTMQERMKRFYNERLFAYETARLNGDDKRMRSVFTDCKTAFGVFPRDRRSTLVNNPEVWPCHQGR